MSAITKDKYDEMCRQLKKLNDSIRKSSWSGFSHVRSYAGHSANQQNLILYFAEGSIEITAPEGIDISEIVKVKI